MAELVSTYNVELVTDSAGYGRICSMLSLHQSAYNECAREVVKSDTSLILREVHDLCYRHLRMLYPDLPSQVVVKAEQDVLAALWSAKSNKHKDFEVPIKKNLSVRLDKRLYGKLSKDGIEITCDIGKGGRVKCGFRQYAKVLDMFEKYRTLDPLVFKRGARLFLSIPFVLSAPNALNDKCVGVDLGMKRLFVTSEGKAFRDKVYLSRRRRLRHLKSELKSKGTKSAKRKLRTVSRKEHNLLKDMCHRAANLLLASTDASIIAMEDLTKIKQRTSKNADGHKRKRHNNAMSQVPFYMFMMLLGYKAARQGRTVVSVNPSYTSQTDSRTGLRDGIRKGCRYYGADGVVLDADYNAAVNIGRRSKHPLSSNAVPYDGTLDFLGQGLCQQSECGVAATLRLQAATSLA